MQKARGGSGAKRETFESQDEILLGVLDAVDRDSKISQRIISRELDIALGLTNAYLKRCMRKGWIRIQQVPRRRYLYYLTPQGFAEKTRLTGEYLSSSFTFFRRAREQISRLLETCVEKDWNRIAFVGISELAEVGTICAHDFPVQLVGAIQPDYPSDTFCGLQVFNSLQDCGPVDAVIVTSLRDAKEFYGSSVAIVGPDCTLVPDIVRMALSNKQNSEKSK